MGLTRSPGISEDSVKHGRGKRPIPAKIGPVNSSIAMDVYLKAQDAKSDTLRTPFSGAFCPGSDSIPSSCELSL